MTSSSSSSSSSFLRHHRDAERIQPPYKTHVHSSGSQVKLTCPSISAGSLSKYDSPHYNWEKDKVTIQNWEKSYNMTGKHLFVLNMTEEDSGFYECKTVTGRGTERAQFLLYVHDPNTVPPQKSSVTIKTLEKLKGKDIKPWFLSEISETGFVTVQSGERVALSCDGTGRPTPSITWFKNNVQLSEKELSQMLAGLRNETNKLVIKHAKVTDSGVYMCQLWNVAGKTNFNYTLTVEDSGEIVPYFLDSYMKNVSADVGQSASFECAAANVKPHDLQWGKPLTTSSNGDEAEGTITFRNQQYLFLRGETFQHPTERVVINRLTIPSVRPSDYGMYICFHVDPSLASTPLQKTVFLSGLHGEGSDWQSMSDMLNPGSHFVLGIIATLVVGVIVFIIILVLCCKKISSSSTHEATYPSGKPIVTCIGQSSTSIRPGSGMPAATNCSPNLMTHFSQDQQPQKFQKPPLPPQQQLNSQQQLFLQQQNQQHCTDDYYHYQQQQQQMARQYPNYYYNSNNNNPDNNQMVAPSEINPSPTHVEGLPCYRPLNTPSLQEASYSSNEQPHASKFTPQHQYNPPHLSTNQYHHIPSSASSLSSSQKQKNQLQQQQQQFLLQQQHLQQHQHPLLHNNNNNNNNNNLLQQV
ncbi:hypothetical protein HELRODRAFT_190667 [Helobdella robusta]|uniref:Ig-like domain-containing protein n=1 Tax=Helobdella robusta TaxID=6412 RepID=T1FS70_HELRO|nr:hypothetical protein HELRODRAFT_190667 [Helobdella robusta]ESO08936.1 hypothetical protein HELRODRAFT_190667 [Helobdella robusta]